MRDWQGAALLLQLSLCWTSARADNVTDPVTQPYLSRPDLMGIVFNITTNHAELTSDGYIFLAPYQIPQSAPYIFDADGTLIWTGHGMIGPSYSHDFRVCEYAGSDHLCMFQGDQGLGFGQRHGIIVDNTFRIVNSVQAGNNLPGSDLHEFLLVDGGKSALLTSYEMVGGEVTEWNVTGVQSYLMDGVFQEVDVATGEVLFEWHSLDHVAQNETYILPNSTNVSGNGTANSPYDYFHINSVDKNAEGDYLVSARHTNAIYKISGRNGTILWRLGGKRTNFTQDFTFRYQHDARFISSNDSITILSFYDNSNDGFETVATFSTGKIVAIDHTTNSAHVLHQYDANQVSTSQGNMQILPNGNIFLGHGSAQSFSEMTANGTLAYQANFGTGNGDGDALQYRTFKFNFTSNPRTNPSVYAYAQNASASTAVYVSWNGATEISSWRFYSGASPQALSFAGSIRKSSFETGTTLSRFASYVVAEAVANNGTGLRNSTATRTFVPSSQLAPYCNAIQCPILGQGDIAPLLVEVQDQQTLPPTRTPTTFAAATSSSAAAPIINQPWKATFSLRLATWVAIVAGIFGPVLLLNSLVLGG